MLLIAAPVGEVINSAEDVSDSSDSCAEGVIIPRWACDGQVPVLGENDTRIYKKQLRTSE